MYVADPALFQSLNKKQRKILIRLLHRLSVSNENEALYEVLNGVLDLDSDALTRLANQLQRTTLENIVATIETLQRRHHAVEQLRELMNVHYKTVRETPDLQKIIENNTWLFGSRYETLGAEEDTFTRIAKSLRDKVPGIKTIDNNDMEEDDAEDMEGVNRQTDLFLARKFPTLDSAGNQVFRCIIIEIKRPGVALNVKHLRQLDDYAAILMKYPEFSSEVLRFELVLVERKISATDVEIKSRLQGQIARGEQGLVSDDPRIKRYVLNWYTLLDTFELSNSFMLTQLRLKRDSLAKASREELISSLQREQPGEAGG